MSVQDTFNGAKNAYGLFGAYIQTVSEELGVVQAFSLLCKMFESNLIRRGKRIKEEMGKEAYTAGDLVSLVKNSFSGIGVEVEMLEESPEVIRWQIGRCPDYEGFQSAGLDGEAIEKYCRCGAKGWNVLVKQLNSNLEFRLRKFKSAPDDACIEEIALKS